MPAWRDVEAAAPELAAQVRSRIEATGWPSWPRCGLTASPASAGSSQGSRDGELWLGMMPRSRKAFDLLRDPRCSLHGATADKDVKDGDVKITGHARAVEDAVVVETFRQSVVVESGFDPCADFHLFRIDVLELARVKPEGDHLVIESWREGGAPRCVERT